MSSADYGRTAECVWSCSSARILRPPSEDSPSCREIGERVEPDATTTAGLDNAELESQHNAEDPDTILEEFLICRRPGVITGGKTVKLQLNCLELSVDSLPPEIFLYHVDIARSDGQWRFACSLMRRVIDAAIRQYAADFGGVRVVHDGGSLMYSPVLLPWAAQTKTFENVDPHSVENAPDSAGTFVVKMKLADVIAAKSLADYYSDPSVNARPALQALGVILRCFARQRLVSIERRFFSIDDEVLVPLQGGAELRWGYHQAVRVADHKLLLNLDKATTTFYSPGDLMELVTATLGARSPSEISVLTYGEQRKLARAIRKIEVVPAHRTDVKRCIYGMSSTSTSETLVHVGGKTMSVSEYFSMRYNIPLQHPNLPLVNVGSRRPGRENWLPIELCKVVPGQRRSGLDGLTVTKQTREFSNTPLETVIDRIRRISFDDNPYLDAFGLKIEQRLVTVNAHVIPPPEVQYANVSTSPLDGQWNLRGKKLVEGAVLRNWGVVVMSSIGEGDVRAFASNLVKMGDECGLSFEDTGPCMVRSDGCWSGRRKAHGSVLRRAGSA